MKQGYLFLLFLCVFGGTTSFAQNNGTTPNQKGPTSLAPGVPDTNYAPAPKKKRKASRHAYSPEQEFYERMMAVAKQRRKAARIMEKPQYSNPLYFGHKRPPKKHSAKKMKYCKECGIRH